MSEKGLQASKPKKKPKWLQLVEDSPKSPERAKTYARELSRLLAEHRVKEWDYVVVGDGSGSVRGRSCGWGVMIFRHDLVRHAIDLDKPTILSGGLSDGTNNVAELMAYVTAMTLLADDERHRFDKYRQHRIAQVHIFTDSDYCVKCGPSTRTAGLNHAAMWAGLDAVARCGLILHWHHVPRDTDRFNRNCDALSKNARKRNATGNKESD